MRDLSCDTYHYFCFENIVDIVDVGGRSAAGSVVVAVAIASILHVDDVFFCVVNDFVFVVETAQVDRENISIIS